MKLNVLIAGQDTLICEGLLAVLSKDESVVADVIEPEPEPLLDKIRVFQPDVLLFSVTSFDEAIIRQIGLAGGEFPDVKTLLLMSAYDERLVIEGLVEGVDGILLNDAETDTERLLKYIHDLYVDGHVLSGKIAKTAMQGITAENKKELLRINLLKLRISVSWRELDILYLLMQGHTNKEMAFFLDVKEKSVRDYISNSYRKIGINKRDQAIAFLKEISDTSGMKDSAENY